MNGDFDNEKEITKIICSYRARSSGFGYSIGMVGVFQHRLYPADVFDYVFFAGLL